MSPPDVESRPTFVVILIAQPADDNLCSEASAGSARWRCASACCRTGSSAVYRRRTFRRDAFRARAGRCAALRGRTIRRAAAPAVLFRRTAFRAFRAAAFFAPLRAGRRARRAIALRFEARFVRRSRDSFFSWREVGNAILANASRFSPAGKLAPAGIRSRSVSMPISSAAAKETSGR
jgi:hypothetical protein